MAFDVRGCHGFGDAWDCHGFDVWGVHGFGAWDRRGYGGACGFPTTLMHGITMAMMVCVDFPWLWYMGSPWL